MAIAGAVVVPHPPLIIPEVGGGREREIRSTIDGCRAAAQRVAGWSPDTVVIASPHIVMYSDYFHIPPGSGGSGSMARFGAPGVRLKAGYDAALRDGAVRHAQACGLPAGTLGERGAEFDHATFIPLWFLRQAGVDCPILRVGLSGLSALEHYRLGQCVARAAEELSRRIVFVASGDLSHKLDAGGPYGFAPEGPLFDSQVTEAMASGDFLRFLTFDPAFCSRAAECGLKAFQMMAGALDGLSVEPELFGYEGPFGVGYACAAFEVTGAGADRRFAKSYLQAERERLQAQKAAEDPWVRLARLSLESYIRDGRRLSSLPEGLPAELTGAAAGAFVSLHLRGQLRGCIGTTSPVMPSVALEIARNAVLAATEDPRFEPVSPGELDLLEYKVDVLGEPEPVDSPSQLDVRRYGVIVSSGRRRGLLLPDLDGVDTVEQQIAIARQKGQIAENESYTLERFEVVRHR